MERRRVAVTGLGTVNPTGLSVEESWQNIRQGKVAIAPIERFDTTDFRVKLAGEIRHFDPTRWMDRKEARRLALFSQYAMAAAVEAIKQAGISCDPENPDPKTGVLISSGIGGLSVIEEEHDRGKEKGFERVSPLFIPLTISNMAAGNIAIRFGFQGMCSCTVTACAGGSNAIGDAFHRIRDGYEDVMVCGGTEAAITPLSIGGFAAMRALSTATDPLRASIPFDADRGGFVMRGRRRPCARGVGARKEARGQDPRGACGIRCKLRRVPHHGAIPERKRGCSLHGAGPRRCRDQRR